MLEKFNEISKKYGKLTVIRRAENYKNGSAQWYCLCDCGNPNEIKVRASSLRDDHTKSCGCLAVDVAKKIHTNKIVSKETRLKQSKTASGKENFASRSKLGIKYPERGKYKRGSLIVRKVNAFLNNAKQKKRECTLSKEEVAEFLVLPCFYCDKESNLTGYKECTGIDRLDNTKGYVQGNCIPCCFHCNVCKNERTLDEFKAHIYNMYNTLIKGNRNVKTGN